MEIQKILDHHQKTNCYQSPLKNQRNFQVHLIREEKTNQLNQQTIQTILKMANQCHVFANQLTFQVQIVKRKSMSTLVSCGDSDFGDFTISESYSQS